MGHLKHGIKKNGVINDSLFIEGVRWGASATATAAAVAVALWTSQGVASGFQLIEQNASGLGNSFAGQAAAAENASTIYFNPAGMTRLPGRQISAAVHYIKPSSSLTDSGSTNALGATGTSGGNAGVEAIVPNMYTSWQIDPQLWLGLGVTVPFGLSTQYDKGWVGDYQTRKSSIKTTDINPSIAYKVNDTVSLGAGVSVQTLEATIERSTYISAYGITRESKLELSETGYGFNLGAMINLSPETRIGLAYRSSIKQNLGGNVNITGIANYSVSTTVKTPDNLSWSIAHQINPKVELLGDVTYTWWSKIKSMPITTTTGTTLDTFEFQFRDTYRLGLGANFKLRDGLMLKAGTAYDQSPVVDQYRTATLPDNDRIWLSFGAKYQATKQLTLDMGYAHVFVKDASLNITKTNQGTVKGQYNNPNVDILSAQATYSF